MCRDYIGAHRDSCACDDEADVEADVASFGIDCPTDKELAAANASSSVFLPMWPLTISLIL